MMPEVIGLWPLKGSNPPLWTAKAADIIRNKETGQEYIRGEIQLFTNSKTPPRVEEDPTKWEFIYIKSGKPTVSSSEYLRDIWVNQALNK